MLPSLICMFVAGAEPLLTIKIFALRDQVGMQAHILKALRGNILTTVLENIEIIVIEGKITVAALMENLLDKPTYNMQGRYYCCAESANFPYVP